MCSHLGCFLPDIGLGEAFPLPHNETAADGTRDAPSGTFYGKCEQPHWQIGGPPLSEPNGLLLFWIVMEVWALLASEL